MKKSLLFGCAAIALLFASCGSLTVSKTATTVAVPTAVSSASVADLNVGERVTYRYTPTKEERASGLSNLKSIAVSALLKQHGNADVLVAPEYEIGGGMKYIEVSGRPATYKNFRSAN